MLERLSVRDRWTYVAIFALILYGIAYVVARNLRPVGPAEIHGIPSAPASTAIPEVASNGDQNDVPERPVSTPVASPPPPRQGGKIDQPSQPPSNDLANNAATPEEASRTPADQAAESTETSSVDEAAAVEWLNDANVDQLAELPGIGPALAQRIATYRETNGPFTSINDLGNVSGIGEKRLAKIRTYLASKLG